MFRDLRAGATLYIYDRAAITLTQDKAVNVSAPHIDKNNMALGMVVDISLNNGVFTFKDGAEVGFTGNLAISPDKTVILREVETQKAANEAQLARVDSIREELPKLDNIIDQLSPERKEKKIQEERLNKIEENVNTLKEMFEEFFNNPKK